jgi:hypothetical protein
MPKSARKSAKPAAKRTATVASEKSSSDNITYTLRTVPRATWERFARSLKDDGRSIDWAMNQFVSRVADGQFKFE